MTSRPHRRSLVAVFGGIAILATAGAPAQEQMAVVDIEPASSTSLEKIAIPDLTVVDIQVRSRGSGRSGKGSELFVHPDASRLHYGVINVAIFGSTGFDLTTLDANSLAFAGGTDLVTVGQ